MRQKLKAIFGQNGLFATHLTNFQARQSQWQMADTIFQAIDSNGTLLCEAGTGTGKTFAYLVPAILSAKKVIISTGTRNLQDQLFHKDIPAIAPLLESLTGRQLYYSVLKGRRNYLCHYRFNKALEVQWHNDTFQNQLQLIKQQLPQLQIADISQFVGIEENATIWPFVTSTKDNCLGSCCPDLHQCHVALARKRASQTDIIICNHHLLMTNFSMQFDNLGEIFPSPSAIIIDEAHQMPDIALLFFSKQLHSKQIINLVNETCQSIKSITKDTRLLTENSDEISSIVHDMNLTLKRYNRRESWTKVSLVIRPLSDALYWGLKRLHKLMIPLANISLDLDNLSSRNEIMLSQIELLLGDSQRTMAHWYECDDKGFNVSLTPLSIAKEFQQIMAHTQCCWVFTSATLTVKSYEDLNVDPSLIHEKSENSKDFDYFANKLGLSIFQTLNLHSPFDYQKQAIIYCPSGLPLPSESHYISNLVQTLIPLITQLGGRTFFLFTSYRSMHEAKSLLLPFGFQLFVQGDAPKHQLVSQFQSAKNAILMGTFSFWEGVDVKGPALSCVIIDKLPFAHPQEPLVSAQNDYYKALGLNGFYHEQLPKTAMSLKQGCGRLIRDCNDAGVIVIADPRLKSRRYGAYFLDCLPETKIVSDLEQVQQQLHEKGVI